MRERREVHAVFHPKGIAFLLRGTVLATLASVFPPTLCAQWWGPPGHPMGAAPALMAPPAPPTVAEFMAAPGAAAANAPGDRRGLTDCEQENKPATGYYVIGPGIGAPAAYLIPPAMSVPCARAPAAERDRVRPGTVAAGTQPAKRPSAHRHQRTEAMPTRISSKETATGEILVDGAGMTLYVFGSDRTGQSFCYADCARNWPPALAPADAQDHGNLSVMARSDGRRQWAYKGQPLYRWAGDKRPGDMTGDGLGQAWAVARTH
ncbi:MAG: hypothetical protein QNK18_08380 [Gammaproteobacteria bacterium]|nr:hypothetical protein [Gammaproteobacteria bacterium]